jgi:hypothetical protein
LKSKQDTLPYVHLYVYKMIKGTRRWLLYRQDISDLW